MAVYHYDASFEGLLSVLDCIDKGGKDPADIIARESSKQDLFHRQQFIPTDASTASLYFQMLQRCLGRDSVRKIFRVFLADTGNKEMLIFRYILLGKKRGRRLDTYITDETVLAVNTLARKVGYEAHRMRGLVRFRELANRWLYAPMRSDHYVLPLLYTYFQLRLARKKWIIHDVRRNKIVSCDGYRCSFLNVVSYREPVFSEDEQEYQKLWQTYFSHIALPGRRNKALQRHYLPHKYREYLIEETEK